MGLLGRERAISASNLPGTKTFPFAVMSAFKIALVEVSRSEPVRVMDVSTSIMMPRSSGLIGRVDRLRATQLTASTSSVGSTINFISRLFPNYSKISKLLNIPNIPNIPNIRTRTVINLLILGSYSHLSNIFIFYLY